MVLTGLWNSKVRVIEVVRSIANLNLKEATDLVEGVPRLLKERVSKHEAEQLKAEVEAATVFRLLESGRTRVVTKSVVYGELFLMTAAGKQSSSHFLCPDRGHICRSCQRCMDRTLFFFDVGAARCPFRR